ncbi:MAG: hypothetical protein KF761_09550 [Salinibacterium sp.]|nr:hypothetical protein [Salinibacterium sp.]
MKWVRNLLATALLVALSGCAPVADSAAQFTIWASSQEFVASVESDPMSDESVSSSVHVHVVIDGAITDDQLTALASSAWAQAGEFGASDPQINFIVGNAWGFSLDEAGVHVAAVNALRAVPSFVAGTVEYRPLSATSAVPAGVHAIVGSQAALRGAYDIVVAAVVDAGGSVDGVPITASTANGAFTILGTGTQQPLTAIGLWQSISGRILISAANATLTSTGTENLEITVTSAEDRATAEAIATDFPDVALTVTVTA